MDSVEHSKKKVEEKKNFHEKHKYEVKQHLLGKCA